MEGNENEEAPKQEGDKKEEKEEAVGKYIF